MRLQNEDQILDQSVRQKIIEEIEGYENKCRKYHSYKRYQCYKDKTSHFVVELLLRQFDTETVEEMRYALSNISIVKKVIDKLSRVYSNGVERIISGDEEATDKLKTIEKVLDVNSSMKKTNRFLKLEKNADLFIKPCPVETKEGRKWAIKLEPLLPHLFDVVEDYYDRTKPMVTILSDYKPPATNLAKMDGARMPITRPVDAPMTSDGIDQKIADKPQDQMMSENKTYIFWSRKHHFTCDSKGNILPDKNNPNNENPFGVNLHIHFAIDQDGSFWAEGGDDLVDGAILINALTSHTIHVGTVQGYGQFYMTGENLPKSIKVGPTKAIIAEYKKDEQAEPKMGFLNANPQLQSLQSLIEMYIALYLTTNNLSTSGVSTQLTGANNLASGVALIIDKAESLEDVQDQRQVFIDKEPDIFEAINEIISTLETDMIAELQGNTLPDDFKSDFVVKFHDPTPIMTESEKLANMKLRQELGLDSMISLIMKDDPSLSEEQAEDKLKKIVEQKLKEKMLGIKDLAEQGVEYDEAADQVDNMSTEDGMPSDEQQPQGNGTPTVGDTAASTDQNVQQLALNGAQVTALVDMVEKVAAGTLPRESAMNMIVTAFNVTPQDADKILGSAGKGFKMATPEPVAPQQTGVVNEGDQDNDGQ